MYGGTRSRRAENRRIRRSRESPAPVTTRLACPVCGEEHRREDHGLQNREALDALDADGLRYLREQQVGELVLAVRRHAEPETLDAIVFVLDALDRRLGRELV